MDGQLWREGCWEVVSELRTSWVISCQQREMKEVFYSNRSSSDRPKTEMIGSVRHAVFVIVLARKQRSSRFCRRAYLSVTLSALKNKNQSLRINNDAVAVTHACLKLSDSEELFLFL